MDGDSMEDAADTLQRKYRKYVRRKVAFIGIAMLICVGAVGVSVTVGARPVAFLDVYDIIYRHIAGTTYAPGTAEWLEDYVIWNVRVPRSLFAAMAGMGLAVAGAVMQGVMKNPLAGPYTTGISSGACFGMAISVTVGFTAVNGTMSLPTVACAFVFSLIPMLLMIFLAPRENVSPATLILTGVAVSYLFNALTTVLMVTVDEDTLANVYEWRLGSFTNITWNCIPLSFGITICCSIALFLLSNKLNAISMGEKEATSLGINVNHLRLVMLSLSSLIVASIVAYAGILSFIGLIAPHMVRLVIEGDNRFVIPGAAAFGAAFLLICDVFARLISDVDAIPVGVIVAFIGAPIFLYMVVRQSRNMW
jgi:iron complex transport system permease protein